jgi:predicted Rossmann fold nucleotide-binding protein DprA/Smf involved in DNA uptake
MGMIYAGIGSRETPKEVLKSMTNYAKELSATGWVLRSGGADGADTAF